jgi:hypothetical protein
VEGYATVVAKHSAANECSVSVVFWKTIVQQLLVCDGQHNNTDHPSGVLQDFL